MRQLINASPKIRGPSIKIFYHRWNLGRFYTTFDFDREYLHNDLRYPKSESQLIETDSFRVQRNKSGELWSTIQKVWNVSLDPPMSTFSGDYISAARGCWSLKFFYTR